MQPDIHQLIQLPLFAGICEADFYAMLKCLGSFQKKYNKEELILLESDKMRSIGIILDGAVHMIKNDEAGNQTLLVTMRAGEIFGESFSCGSHLDSRVSFIAASSCKVLFLPFYRVLHSCRMTCTFHHRLIENMVQLIADKNVRLMQKIEIISKKTLREKIYTYLQQQALEQNSKQFTIPLKRLELAEYLCADRCAISRELKIMQEEGLILFNKNSFEMLKRLD